MGLSGNVSPPSNVSRRNDDMVIVVNFLLKPEMFLFRESNLDFLLYPHILCCLFLKSLCLSKNSDNDSELPVFLNPLDAPCEHTSRELIFLLSFLVNPSMSRLVARS